MAGQEIGLSEFRGLIGRSWKWILGSAGLAGLIAIAVLLIAVPAQYESSVRLLAQPQLQGAEGGLRPTGLYISLLRSDSVLEKTMERLRLDGTLTDTESLSSDDHLGIQARGGDTETFVINLTAKSDNAEKAASIANAWAEVFIEESREMLTSTASSSGVLLEQELVPTREQMAELETRRAAVLDEYRELEEKTSTSWDQRISSSRDRAERDIADYQSATRSQLEEAVERHLTGAGQPAATAVRSQLLEIVSVRSQLAQTPRVITLEKAASDETLAELIAEGGNADQFDRTLVSQELNPLYDQLAVRVLELESELDGLAGEGASFDASPVLTLLEKIQRERAGGLVGLSEAKGLEIRTMRRRRGRELEKISEQRGLALAEIRVQLDQLTELEKQLSARFNQTVISDLLQRIDLISVAAPAVAQPQTRPRGLPLKVAVAVFLGGMLGLMIALFRSTGA